MVLGNLSRRTWNWLWRFKHRKGYGVHSPSDFYLISFVIYEDHPFYAYSKLKEIRPYVDHLPHYREKIDRLLFRLINYLQPDSIIEIGTGSGLEALYMSSAKQCDIYTFDDGKKIPEVKQLLEIHSNIVYRTGETEKLLHEFLQHIPLSGVVHIGHTPFYKEIFETLVPHVMTKTCFIIASPYASKQKKRWWKETIKDTRTGVTFDLYDIGIVFFDKKRVKEHRIVDFF